MKVYLKLKFFSVGHRWP